ncbi:MAG: Yip1 family protein [Candidatus Micrarchaeia archaeon]
MEGNSGHTHESSEVIGKCLRCGKEVCANCGKKTESASGQSVAFCNQCFSEIERKEAQSVKKRKRKEREERGEEKHKRTEVELVRSWLMCYIKPVETAKHLKEISSYTNYAINIAAFTIIFLLTMAIYMVVAYFFYPDLNRFMPEMTPALAIVAILLFINFAVFVAFASAATYIVARILKGKGRYLHHLFASSTILPGFAILSLVFEVFRIILLFVPYGFYIAFVFNLFLLYFVVRTYTKILVGVHGFDSIRAIACWAVPLIILVVLIMLYGILAG